MYNVYKKVTFHLHALSLIHREMLQFQQLGNFHPCNECNGFPDIHHDTFCIPRSDCSIGKLRSAMYRFRGRLDIRKHFLMAERAWSWPTILRLMHWKGLFSRLLYEQGLLPSRRLCQQVLCADGFVDHLLLAHHSIVFPILHELLQTPSVNWPSRMKYLQTKTKLKISRYPRSSYVVDTKRIEKDYFC